MKPSIDILKIGLEALKQQSKKENRWSKTFDEMFDGLPVYQASNTLHEAIMKILQKVYKDEEDDVIGWWVYDKDFGRRKGLNIYEEGTDKIIPTRTIEDLYNYLIKYNFQDDMEEINELINGYKFEYHEPIIRYTDDKTQHNPPWTIYVEGKIKYPDGKEEPYQFPWQTSSVNVKFNK